jgi:hypothetical protein
MGRRRKEATRTVRPHRFGVYLDAKTLDALRRAALAEDISATELVERLIQQYVGPRRKG